MRNNDDPGIVRDLDTSQETHPERDSKMALSSVESPLLQSRQFCVPEAVITAVPACASACIETFVQQQYSGACSQKGSLEFLCTTPNNSGLTIGEGGLQCIYSDCTGSDLEDIGVYYICTGIANSLPETLGTITATRDPMAATSTLLYPTSIGTPTSLETASGITTATGSPVVPNPQPSPSSMSLSIFPSSSSSVVSVPASTSAPPTSHTTSSKGLNNAQIAGVSVAGFATVAIACTLLTLLAWLRKRRGQQRRLDRRSMQPDPLPPAASSPVILNTGPQTPVLENFYSNQRFYAQTPADEKRRSFWRKSIKPEEIGVAVSPEVPQKESPASTTSHHTTSHLLPTDPMSPLWPAPLRLSRQQQRPTIPAENSITTAGETKSDPTGLAIRNHNLDLRVPPNQVIERQPVRQQQPPSLSVTNMEARATRQNARMPLTPVYDNGNFQKGQVLGNQRTIPSDEPEQRPRSRASEATEIEEDVTPEQDLFDQPSVPQAPSRISPYPLANILPEYMSMGPQRALQPYSDPHNQSTTSEPDSPIKGLRYPKIPRPAAVSRQAERVARPRAAAGVHTDGRPILLGKQGRSQSDDSHIYTDSSSSQGGYARFRRPGMGQNNQLRRPPDTMNTRKAEYEGQGPFSSHQDPYSNSHAQASSANPQFARPTTPTGPQRVISPPQEELRLTPGITRGGDLYFTVDG